MNFGEFFLKDPATFPAKTAGAPWGREGVSIALAGLLFHFSGLSQRQAVFVRQRYMDFGSLVVRVSGKLLIIMQITHTL